MSASPASIRERIPSAAWLRDLQARGNGRWLDIGFGLLVLAGCALLFYQVRLTTFRLDDWVFALERPPFGWDYLLVPHNEHWSTFMKGIFQALFAVFGLHSYLPYLAALVVAQGLAAFAVYGAVSAAGGRALGASVGIVLLFMGSAHENIYWYSGIGNVLATAAGAAATWVLIARPVTRRTTVLAGILLVLSVMSSGMGLGFAFGLGAATILDPARRPAIAAPVVAVATYLVWTAIWGSNGPVTLDAVTAAPAFMFIGASHAMTWLTGLGPYAAPTLVVVVVGAVWLHLARGTRPAFAAVAGSVGLVAFLGIVALARDLTPLASQAAMAPRYVQTSTVCIAIAVAGLLGRPADRGAGYLRMVALAPLLAFSLIGNGLALVDAGDDYSAEATDLRAMLTVLEREAGAPAVLGSSPLGAPAAEVKALLAEHGSPVRDDLRPSVVLPVYPDAIDRGRFMLVSYALVVTPVPGTLVAGSTVPPVTSTYLASATPVDGCLDVRTLGPDSQVSFPVVAGGGLRVGVDGWGDLGVYLAHDAETFQEAASRHQPVVGATVYEIATPDMGAGFTWRLNLKLGAGITAARICATK